MYAYYNVHVLHVYVCMYVCDTYNMHVCTMCMCMRITLPYHARDYLPLPLPLPCPVLDEPLPVPLLPLILPSADVPLLGLPPITCSLLRMYTALPYHARDCTRTLCTRVCPLPRARLHLACTMRSPTVPPNERGSE